MEFGKRHGATGTAGKLPTCYGVATGKVV